MRVRVVGPGAVGTLFGALLADAGHEVSLVGRDGGVPSGGDSAIRAVLPDRWMSFRPAGGPSPAAAGSGMTPPETTASEPDLVVVALRRDHYRELRSAPQGAACLALSRALGSRAPLLLLNSEEQDTEGVPSLAGGERILRGLTLWTAVRLQPRTVELADRRPTFMTVRDPVLKPVTAALRAAGVETVESDDIEACLRSFALWRLLFLPAAMCCATHEYFLSYAEGREIAAGVLEEGFRVAERSGGELRRLPVMDARELLARLRKARQPAGAARFEPDRGYNSVLQALLRGEKTEARELNERLVKEAGRVGVEASWNWRLSRKLSRIPRLGFYRDPAELYQALL